MLLLLAGTVVFLVRIEQAPEGQWNVTLALCLAIIDALTRS